MSGLACTLFSKAMVNLVYMNLAFFHFFFLIDFANCIIYFNKVRDFHLYQFVHYVVRNPLKYLAWTLVKVILIMFKTKLHV